jgi:hypothetical protein
MRVFERNRKDLRLEEPVVDVRCGPPVALERERVHLVAGDAEPVGEHLGDPELDAEGVVRALEKGLTERPCPAASVGRHGGPRHRFDSARDGEVVGAGDHALSDEVHGLLRRSALPVDRRRGYVPRQTGGDPRVARDVAALFP